MRRLALATTITLTLLGTACSGDGGGGGGGVQVAPYPVASTPTITPSRTLTDSKGLRYLVDDATNCVQIDLGGGIATDCIGFTPTPRGVGTDQAGWRSGNDAVALFIYSAEGLTASTDGRVVARWFSPEHDVRPDDVDAIRLAPDVYVLAYRSPLDVPIWGVQLRTANGRQVQSLTVLGAVLNAPR